MPKEEDRDETDTSVQEVLSMVMAEPIQPEGPTSLAERLSLIGRYRKELLVVAIFLLLQAAYMFASEVSKAGGLRVVLEGMRNMTGNYCQQQQQQQNCHCEPQYLQEQLT